MSQIDRKTGLGGSDMAAIMGYSRYKSAYSVWAEKMGLIPEKEDTESMWVGLELEEPLRRRAEAQTGVAIVKPDTMRHPTIPYFYAHPDGLIAPDAGWECKVIGPRGKADDWGEEGTDQIPNEALFQCLYYLWFTDRRRWDVLAHFIMAATKHYRVSPVKRLQDEMVDRGHEFWQKYVLGELEPPKDDSEATRKAVERVYWRNETDEYVNADPYCEERMFELAEVEGAIEELEKRQHYLQGVLKSFIGAKKGIQGFAGRATWSVRDGGVRWKSVAEALCPDKAKLAEIAAKFPGKTSRPFLFKPKALD